MMRTRAVADRIETQNAAKEKSLAEYGIKLPTDLPEKVFLKLAQRVLSFIDRGNYLFGSRLTPNDRAEIYKRKLQDWCPKLVRLVNGTGLPIGHVWYINPTQPHVLPPVSRTSDEHQKHERHDNYSFLAIIRVNGKTTTKHHLSTLEIVEDDQAGAGKTS